MTSRLPGITGALFPSRYLSDGLPAGVLTRSLPDLERTRRHLERWWTRVAATCGPATGLRALFDIAAMPLFAHLGFRAHDAAFDRHHARVRLSTPTRTPVALVILPWASRPSALWRDVLAASHASGARWGFVFAPPYLSLVDARGHAVRRSADFTLPDALDARSLAIFLATTTAAAFDPAGGPRVETLVAGAEQFQDRVREDLQAGVVDALETLASALPAVASPSSANSRLDEALTVVYRVLFLLFAESRDLVPRHHPIYRDAYAIATLCREAIGNPDARGLWDGLAAISRLSRAGCRRGDLIVRPFNGRLFARAAAPSLETPAPSRRSWRGAIARDAAVRRALVALATRPGRAGREDISYQDLGVEQLGAVYERVLDLDPAALIERRAACVARAPRSSRGHSHVRKQTGTFYTPQSLAEFVVRRTLAPLVAGASADAILALRVVDPAMGSGAFLVAACRYLSTAYERALVDEGRCAEIDLDAATRVNIRRRIAEQCLAGVDTNPVAVQLARLSLWLATLAEGKPLGFLDHRLRTGNSLVGASPDDLLRVTAIGRRERPSTLPLFGDDAIEASMRFASAPMLALLARRDDSIADVRAKEAAWARMTATRWSSSGLGRLRSAASLWCARWFWPADASTPAPSPGETRAAIDALLKGDATLGAAQLSRWLGRARELETQHGFFHWPLEFADIFYDEHGRRRPNAGFDAVIGNPPWEMLRREPRTKEPRNPAPRQARGALSPSKGGTPEPRPSTSSGRPEPVEGRNQLVSFIRGSGLYPSCDRGHVNLYQPFVERALSLTKPNGRVGLIVPWGLATDDGAATLRSRLLDRASVDTIVGLDNGNGLFPIHRGLRFLVVVANPGRPSTLLGPGPSTRLGPGPTREIRARFGVRTPAELDDLPDSLEATGASSTAYPVRLTPARLATIGGPTRRIPDVRRPHDLLLLERLATSMPALGAADGWRAQFGRELNATEDRQHFGARGLPVVEGKHIGPFAVDVPAAAAHIERRDAERLLPRRGFDAPRLAYRDVSGVANRVSLIAAIVPAGVVTTHTLFCVRNRFSLEQQHFLCGVFNSFVLNAVVRMLMGVHLTTSLVESLPVPAWRGGHDERLIARLARRLATRPSDRRAAAMLQAAVARLYGLDRDDFARILEGFPLVPAAERHAALVATRAFDMKPMKG